ncbi:hypothetical protein JCM33374_g5421 [Metschnikowia sp. JCM 33374]|nr:hypothetical protein JCM33374_g5421 [Metschnikowia sp. JCM 33374]
MTSLTMKKDVGDILDGLASESYPEIVRGLDTLEIFLKSLAPSVRKHHRSGMLDSKLLALISLQNNFQSNIASGLLSTYSFFSNTHLKVENQVLIKANYLLSGMLLIHPESRALFSRGRAMAVMLSFLDSKVFRYSEDVSVSFVSLLIHILIKNVKNMRSFEENNGCQLLIHHLSVSPNDTKDGHRNGDSDEAVRQKILHFKVIEFLIFYLADESELLNLPQNNGARSVSVSEKADLFRPKFPGIDDLIKNLNDLTSLRSFPVNI